MLYHDLAARPIFKAHAIGHSCVTHTSHPVDQFTRNFQSDMGDVWRRTMDAGLKACMLLVTLVGG